jgi:hypothetical protein
LPSGLGEVKEWDEQGAELLAGLTGSEKFKSLAVHAHVKLAEALERCSRLCPSAYTPDGDPKPNKLKAAVCCQLLGDIAGLCGPMEGPLKRIEQELVSSKLTGVWCGEE